MVKSQELAIAFYTIAIVIVTANLIFDSACVVTQCHNILSIRAYAAFRIAIVFNYAVGFYILWSTYRKIKGRGHTSRTAEVV